MARAESQATQRLRSDLAVRRIDVTARQLERWRQAGFFSTARQGRGRGAGSVSAYDPAVVELLVDVATLVDQQRSLRDAALILLARDKPMPVHVARKAIVDYLHAVDADLERAEATAPAEAIAALRRSREGRTLFRNLSAAGLGEGAFQTIVSGLRGSQPEWVTALIEGSGLPKVAGDLLDPATRRVLDDLLGQFTIPNLVDEVSRASESELRHAVAISRRLFPFVGNFVEVLARLRKQRLAFQFPVDPVEQELGIARWSVLVLWARRRGLDIDRAIELEARFGPAVQALAGFLSTLSFSRGALFGPDEASQLARLKSYERRAIDMKIRAFAEANPEAIEVIAAASAETNDDMRRA